MENKFNRPSMTSGIVTAAFGCFLLSPLLYRHESIDWNRLFSYIFLVLGIFLLVIGLIAIYRARRDTALPQELTLEKMAKRTDRSVATNSYAAKIDAFKYKEVPGLSTYYKFAMAIGLSPLLPLALFIFVRSTCSIFGTGLGFACKYPDNNYYAFGLDAVAYFAGLGWVLSLPVWALLVFAGKLLKVR